MLGGTTKGFCRREWALWYGDREDDSPCQLPLSDGKVCGDVYCDPARAQDGKLSASPKNAGRRCPYSSKLSVDMSQCKLTTYADIKSGDVLCTGGAGEAAHSPERIDSQP